MRGKALSEKETSPQLSRALETENSRWTSLYLLQASLQHLPDCSNWLCNCKSLFYWSSFSCNQFFISAQYSQHLISCLEHIPCKHKCLLNEGVSLYFPVPSAHTLFKAQVLSYYMVMNSDHFLSWIRVSKGGGRNRQVISQMEFSVPTLDHPLLPNTELPQEDKPKGIFY